MDRRALLDVLARAGLVAALPSLGFGPERAVVGVVPILQQALPNVTLDGWELTAVEVTYAPGEIDGAHRHPGFVFGYVVAGTLRFQVDEQKETIYHSGQMFYEAPGSVHRVSANASATQPCRFLAMIFAKRGSPLTAPAPTPPPV
jgi:quercetin dioxygenase-like cupin family protein